MNYRLKMWPVISTITHRSCSIYYFLCTLCIYPIFANNSTVEENECYSIGIPILLATIIISILVTIFIIYCVVPHIPYLSKFSPINPTYRNEFPKNEAATVSMQDPHTQLSSLTSTPIMLEGAESNVPREIRFDELEPNFKQLGSGTFGMVFKTAWKRPIGNLPVAVKILNGASYDEVRNEASIMNDLRHPNILRVFGMTKGQDGCPMIVTPFMPKGSLLKFLQDKKVSSLFERYKFCLELSSGLEYLHQQKIVHCDVAARNCLIAEDLTLKICDFGLSNFFEDYYRGVYLNANKLPVRWMAPEVLQNMERIKYSTYADIYALGVALWEIFSNGEPPYKELDNEAAIKHILAGNRLERPELCPENVYEMLLQLWHTEKRMRKIGLTKVFLQQLMNVESGSTPLSLSAVKGRLSDAKSIGSFSDSYLGSCSK